MNILFTLCGRAGSKGVKGKNARDFLDIPLVWYSMSAIALYKEEYGTGDRIDIVVNTDSHDLIKLVQEVKDLSVGIQLRNEDLAGDKVPKVSVIKDCLERAERDNGVKYNQVVDLDITSPLRTVKDVYNAIIMLSSRPDFDVVYSVVTSRRNPYFNMAKEENGYFGRAFTSNYTTRQEAPVFYDKNASIYAYSPEALKNKDAVKFFWDKCGAIKMLDTGILDIDSEEDFDMMQIIAKYLFENKDGFIQIYQKASSWK